MILFPCCKINLGLDILRRRDDGYHDLSTVMIPVNGVCDSLEVVAMDEAYVADTAAVQLTDDGLVTASFSGEKMDCRLDDNLICKAYRQLAAQHRLGPIRVHLHKCIPSGAGLGGGSSDAAAMLLALNTLFDIGLDRSMLEAEAAQLGSDVPFFIDPRPKLCTSRGEVMSDITLDLHQRHIVIVKPSFGITTAEAYRHVSPRVPDRELSLRLEEPFSQWRESVVNDFERTLFDCHPALRAIKEQLYQCGAIYASLSGSGSALYGIFDRQPRYVPVTDGERIYNTIIR